MQLAERAAAIQTRLQALDGLPWIEGSRVRLRAPGAEDIDPLFALFSDPEVMRYWSRDPMRERGEAIAYMQSIIDGFMKRELLNWIIADRSDDRMIGTCTIYDLQPQHLRAAVGYALSPRRHGQGLAREAVALAIDWGFHTLQLNRIEADVEPRNRRSSSLLLALGFQHEGVLRERFCTSTEIQPSSVYGLLASEWPAAAGDH
jgi:RimJ/RimL family protein N-acetyltransferase